MKYLEHFIIVKVCLTYERMKVLKKLSFRSTQLSKSECHVLRFGMSVFFLSCY